MAVAVDRVMELPSCRLILVDLEPVRIIPSQQASADFHYREMMVAAAR